MLLTWEEFCSKTGRDPLNLKDKTDLLTFIESASAWFCAETRRDFLNVAKSCYRSFEPHIRLNDTEVSNVHVYYSFARNFTPDTEVPAAYYYANLAAGSIQLGIQYPSHPGTIKITYETGTPIESVPAQVKQAVATIADFDWIRRGKGGRRTTNADGYSVPEFNENYPPVVYQTIDQFRV